MKTGTHSGVFVFERRGQHGGEEFEGDREEEFHERDDDENSERDEAEQVLRRAPQLNRTLGGQNSIKSRSARVERLR